MAERTSVLLAWHLASEIGLFFLSVSPLSHSRKISLDFKQMELSDVLVTGIYKGLGRMLTCLVGRFGGGCFHPCAEEHPCSSKSTLKSLKVFCTLHFKSWVLKSCFLFHRDSYAHIKLTHGWAPALTVICQLQRSREWRYSCLIIHHFFSMNLTAGLKNLDLIFLFFFLISIQLNSLYGYKEI